jgi:sarcosine oxidase subunit beta
MKDRTADVVIVGGGINGAATAFYLARLGIRKIVIVERSYPGSGASGRGMGLLRQYHTNEAEARLAIKSLAVFRNWQDEIGGTCGYVETGFLWIDDVINTGGVKANVDLVNRLGGHTKLIDADTLAGLQPHMNVVGSVAAYEENCGYAYGALATDALLAGASRKGARLLTRTKATSLLVESGRVTGVETSAGTISTNTVVVAAGAWAAPLAETAGLTIPIQPRRLTLGRIYLPESVKAPMTFLDGRYDTSFKADGNGTALISMRDGRYGEAMDAETPLDEVDDAAIQDGLDRIAQRIPALKDAQPARTWTGMDGFSPDYKGIYGPIDDVAGLFVCGGSSEKGFKVAPAVGQGMAQMITTGRSDLIGDASFSPQRHHPVGPVRDGWINVGQLI